MLFNVRLEALELLGRDRLVHLAPPDLIGGLGLLDEELVVGAAAGMRRRHGAERPSPGRHDPFAPAEGVLVELRRRQIPVHTLFSRYAHGLFGWPHLAAMLQGVDSGNYCHIHDVGDL